MPADIIFFHQQIIVTEDVIVLDYAILQDHWRINNCTRKIHNVWIIVLKFLENADILHSFHHTGSSKITQSVYFNRNINFSEIEILDNVAYSPKRIERKTVQNLRSIKCVMLLLKITTPNNVFHESNINEMLFLWKQSIEFILFFEYIIEHHTNIEVILSNVTVPTLIPVLKK